MDFIISFFRDVLDGPIYVIVTIICLILICSCIGYLAEVSINKKKQKNEYDDTHSTVSNENSTTVAQGDIFQIPIQNAESVVTSNNTVENSPEVLASNEVIQQPITMAQPVEVVGTSVSDTVQSPITPSSVTTMPIPEVSQPVVQTNGVNGG